MENLSNNASSSSSLVQTTATTGTVTTTMTLTTTSNENNTDQRRLFLRLDQNKANVSFSADTIDNENMGKKSSKRCCIYHKIKKFAESDSDESDSDTEIASKEPREGRPALLQRFHA